MELHIPKLREGSYFPSLLEPRRRSERALLAVIQQAYVEGVSTRRVDDLVGPAQEPGVAHLSSWTWWWMASWAVNAGRWTLPLPGHALTQKSGRTAGSSTSVVVATAVNGEGKREIIGMDVGTSEDGAFWLLPTLPVRQGPQWGGAGGIGRSSGTPRRHRRSLRRSQLATVNPLHDQPAHSGPQARPALGGHHGPQSTSNPPPMRYTPNSTG